MGRITHKIWRKIHGKSIARQWFVNSFSVVAALLLITDISLYFMLKGYYYTAVQQYLQTEAGIIKGIISRYSENDGENPQNVRRTVEEFEGKNRMELMMITKEGKVALMSSGFSTESVMPDYESAVRGDIGTYAGTFPNGERFMAVTVLLDEAAGDYNAIRMVTSLETVNSEIGSIILLITFASVLVLLFVLFLGLYFVKSIVSPIQAIGGVARDFAKGNLSRRVPVPERDDEISELCTIFNNMADELNSAEALKNDFISSVSHELRTPLTAIKGWSETMLESTGDKVTVERGISVVLAETARLSLMVEELLDFSHIQRGEFRMDMANMDVLAELADAVLVYTERAFREGIKINYTESEGAAIIYGDKNRIRQLFINIIDNALKYSSCGSEIDISGKIEGKNVIIKIADKGRGIPPDDLPKIKTRFYKGGNSLRGSGIGLAIADEITERHKGRLQIDSTLGVGTTVTIVFSKGNPRKPLCV